MLDSTILKKEIIKSFLKNPNMPFPSLCNLIHKKLSSIFFKDELVLYTSSNKTLKAKILDKSHDNLYVILTDDNIQFKNVDHFSLRRVCSFSKNDILCFLRDNTLDTVFGKILKNNVVSDLKNEEKRMKGDEVKMGASFVERGIIEKKKDEDVCFLRDLKCIFKSDETDTYFEVFCFINAFKECFNGFYLKMECLKSNNFDECVVELMKFISNMTVGDFISILENISDNKLKNEFDSILYQAWKKYVILEDIDNMTKTFLQILSQFNYKIQPRKKVYFVKQVVDIIIQSESFKSRVDFRLDSIRTKEKQRWELNGKLRKLNLSKNESDIRKNEQMLQPSKDQKSTDKGTKKIEEYAVKRGNLADIENDIRKIEFDIQEIDRFIYFSRAKLNFGSFDKVTFYFVDGVIYCRNFNELYIVKYEDIDDINRKLKGNKNAAGVLGVLRALKMLFGEIN